MTPWTGFVAAIIAGWIIRDPRRAIAPVVVPFLVVLATQSWILAAGRGISPPSTVTPFPQSLSYWVVQAIFLALALGIAAELAALRRARALPPGGAGAGRRTALAWGLLAGLTALFVTGALLDTSPVRHHSANGAPPLQGLIAIVLCVVTFGVLSAATIRARRAAAKANLAGASASAVVASGRR